MTDLDRAVIKAYADNNMNASKTGRALYMHHVTVRYHLEKVKRITGLNPFNFHDLVKLIQDMEV